MEGEVAEHAEPTPIGKARVVREGSDVTIVAASYMTIEAERAVAELERLGVSVELIDVRSVRPLDVDAIANSVSKTGRLVVVDTSWTFCGLSAEVAAVAAERAQSALKAPVIRLGQADCPAPVSKALEEAFFPKPTTIARAALATMGRGEHQIGDIDVVDDFKGPY
jgi:pyruvate dehydrogenase E1 component beta subunit